MLVSHFQLQGKRPYQEDAFQMHPTTGLFIICDGVGGAEKGEVASKVVSQAVAEIIIQEEQKDDPISLVMGAVQAAHHELIARLNAHPEEEGMGTTMALLLVQNGRATVAHIGDSRIYYVRPSERLYWRTKDHSLVQEMFEGGLLKTEEDMAQHPMRNQITRALQAKGGAPEVQPDISTIEHVQPGDLFLLCSDGVLEPFVASDFIRLLGSTQLDIQEKRKLIESACAAKSSDNNTCIIIEINPEDVPDPIEGDPGVQMLFIPENDTEGNKKGKSVFPKFGQGCGSTVALLLLMLIVISWLAL